MDALPNPSPDSSGLLSRLQAFLPQMENANKKLMEKIAKEGDESVRIDLGAGEEDEEESDSDDCNQGQCDTKLEGDGGDEAVPVVEMNLAIGPFGENNPILMAEEDENQMDTDDKDEAGSDTEHDKGQQITIKEGSEKEACVENLLLHCQKRDDGGDSGDSQGPGSCNNLLSMPPPKKDKVLIEEIMPPT
uniref:Uncharacterized protein n=2 Tax=Heterosigma akashiwo TaxID=2829 RepID=A0A6V1QED1_HETAK|mmetsp:Transcript_34114/g.59329  ORF Transcript_34114/g.59329 Transcript_34114/m.59329 type:complete len:190 (-) Transcript_34114:96-665(-)